jgi:hypothetical protein
MMVPNKVIPESPLESQSSYISASAFFCSMIVRMVVEISMRTLVRAPAKYF